MIVRYLRRYLLTGALSGAAGALTFSTVLAANPSSFLDTHQSCNWQGLSRIIGTHGQAWTTDVSTNCLSHCYLYGQWINGGGTYYTYNGIFQSCIHYREYPNSSQTELYGEHAVIKNAIASSYRSTDAYCGGSPC